MDIKTELLGERVFLGGGFKYFLFSPLPGEMIQFDYYFSDGSKPPTRFDFDDLASCQCLPSHGIRTMYLSRGAGEGSTTS